MKRTKVMNYERFRKVRSFWKYSAIFIAVSSAFFLTACDDTKDVSVFQTIQQCEQVQVTQADKDKCTLDYQNALKSTEKIAPKYNTKEDCEDEFGTSACQSSTYTQTTSTGNHFMWFPIMSGYSTSSANYPSQPLYSSTKYSSPMHNNFVDAKGNSFGSGTGKKSVSTSYLAPKPPTTSTVTRGGFGSSVRSNAVRASSTSYHGSSSHSFGG